MQFLTEFLILSSKLKMDPQKSYFGRLILRAAAKQSYPTFLELMGDDIEERRLKDNKRVKEWRKKNPEKTKAALRRYYLKGINDGK